MPKIRSETGQKGFFINKTTVLPLSGCVGQSRDILLGGSRGLLPSLRGAKRFKMARPRIIPVHNSTVATSWQTEISFKFSIGNWPRLKEPRFKSLGTLDDRSVSKAKSSIC